MRAHTTNSKELAAFDAHNGKLKWRRKTEWPVKTSPVLDGDDLFFGDIGGYFYVVDAASGRVVHEFRFPGYPAKWGFAKTPPVIVGNTLYASADRWVYAMRVSDLRNGIVSPDAAPPKQGPSQDWCPFDPNCTSGNASGVVILR